MATVAELAIVNQVLLLLGDETLATVDTNTARGRLINSMLEDVRKATLADHPWNFAITRATLYAYTEPTGTLTPGAGALTVDTTAVTFTASGTPFTSTAVDAGKLLTADAGGEAVITSVTSTSVAVATINIAFGALTAIATGAWRLYNARPAWGYNYRVAVPSGALRVWRLEDSEPYQVEQGYIVSDADALNVRYITDISDLTLWSAIARRALVYHLAAGCVEGVTGQAGKMDRFWQLYQGHLKQARLRDGQEGSAEVIRSTDLIDVRRGGGRDNTRAWGR
jgi:hypothetical protein